MHLAAMHRAIEQHRPSAVVIDPISSLITAGDAHEVKSMLVRLFDYLKMNGITCVVTSLTAGAGLEETSIGISSLIDTWLQVRDIEIAAERTRGLYLVKSRGMGHSNQVREFLITPQGLDLLPVAVGAEGVLTGSARLSLEADARAKTETRRHERERAMRALARRKQIVDAQIDSLRAEFATEEEEARARLAETQDRDNAVAELAARRARVGAGAKDAGRRP
jgi:circadian clock protein KaiC